MHIVYWHGFLYVILDTFPRPLWLGINVLNYLGDGMIDSGIILLAAWFGVRIELPF
jgi:hypothetical protein